MHATLLLVLIIGISQCSASLNPCQELSARYGSEQFWLPDPSSCHLYIVCVPGRTGDIHSPTSQSCGLLFWSPSTTTCRQHADNGASCGNSAQPLTSETTGTTSGGQPYVCAFYPHPEVPRRYSRLGQDTTSYQSCVQYMHFSADMCTCVLDDDAPEPTCDRRSFLNFNFDGSLDDSSCTNAAALALSGEIGFRASRYGKSAVFDGHSHVDIPVLRNIFAGNYLSEFSISMFFRSNGIDNELLFDNGDEQQKSTVFMGHMPSYNRLNAQITVSGGNNRHHKLIIMKIFYNNPNRWNHIAYVFKNGVFTFTVNGDIANQSSTSMPAVPGVTYTLDNMDEPLSLGGRTNGEFMFNGEMDEMRIFKRALSLSEIKALSEHSF